MPHLMKFACKERNQLSLLISDVEEHVKYIQD